MLHRPCESDGKLITRSFVLIMVSRTAGTTLALVIKVNLSNFLLKSLSSPQFRLPLFQLWFTTNIPSDVEPSRASFEAHRINSVLVGSISQIRE